MGLLHLMEVSIEAGRGCRKPELQPTLFTRSLAHHFLQEVLPISPEEVRGPVKLPHPLSAPLPSLGYHGQWPRLYHPGDLELPEGGSGSLLSLFPHVCPWVSTGQAALPREGEKDQVSEGVTTSAEGSWRTYSSVLGGVAEMASLWLNWNCPSSSLYAGQALTREDPQGQAARGCPQLARTLGPSAGLPSPLLSLLPAFGSLGLAVHKLWWEWHQSSSPDLKPRGSHMPKHAMTVSPASMSAKFCWVWETRGQGHRPWNQPGPGSHGQALTFRFILSATGLVWGLREMVWGRCQERRGHSQWPGKGSCSDGSHPVQRMKSGSGSISFMA